MFPSSPASAAYFQQQWPWNSIPPQYWPHYAIPNHIAQAHAHLLSSQLPLDVRFHADMHRSLQLQQTQELSLPSPAMPAEDTPPSSTAQSVEEPRVTQAPSPRLPGATSKQEVATAEALKRLFGPTVDFKKVRPPWLINPVSGKRLEFDLAGKVQLGGKSVEVAFEIDGESHFVYPSRWFPLGTREAFKAMQARDKCKEAQAHRRGVILVRVPWTLRCDPVAIEAFLREEFHCRGITLPVRAP
jgi:hypothetical protein